MPPILSIHGNADEVVPYEQSIELTRTLRNVHSDAEMIAVPNGVELKGAGIKDEGKEPTTQALQVRLADRILDFSGRARCLLGQCALESIASPPFRPTSPENVPNPTGGTEQNDDEGNPESVTPHGPAHKCGEPDHPNTRKGDLFQGNCICNVVVLHDCEG